MSFGRSPHYIYSDGTNVTFHLAGGKTVAVPEEALAQYLAHLAARGDGPINTRIEIHKQERPDLFTDDFGVIVRGGFRRPSEQDARVAIQELLDAREAAQGDEKAP